MIASICAADFGSHSTASLRPRARGALPVEAEFTHRRRLRRNAAPRTIAPHAGERAPCAPAGVGADVARRAGGRVVVRRRELDHDARVRDPAAHDRLAPEARGEAGLHGIDEREIVRRDGDPGFHAAREARLRRQPLEIVEPEAAASA